MRGLLGSLISRAAAGELDDDTIVRPNRKFTQKDIVQLAERAAEQWRNEYANLLSCFDLTSDFGL
jgi:hypothetical protein